jgi:DNA-binding transcriptional MerR regulator
MLQIQADLRSSMSMLDIAEVAQRTGLPASTLRYYEEKHLIESVGRRGLRRLFPAHVLERLALIDLGRTAGFSLEEIASMFAAARIDRGRLLAKADELDRTIAKLAAMRDGLRHAARCQAPSHMQCPKFRRLLKLAGRTRPRADKRRAAPSRSRSAARG